MMASFVGCVEYLVSRSICLWHLCMVYITDGKESNSISPDVNAAINLADIDTHVIQ